VFQYICEEFPEADTYTLAHNRDKALPYFLKRGVRTTWMNGFVRSMEAFRWAFPIASYVMESLDLRRYDVVLSSSAHVAKYVRVPNGIHICYCYIPTRPIWHFEEYFGSSIKGALFKLFLPYLRKRDYAAAQRIDQFISISKASQEYIRQYYDRDSEVIFSPVDLDRFSPSGGRKDHYLIVSRLEHWKRVDYAIEAFNKLGLPLRVVGTGKEEQRLKAMAKPNISFLGPIADESLAREYREACAVIFTPQLEYGLIPLEANASGTPVICYGKGGITETMVPLEEAKTNGGAPTAVFFYEQTVDALVAAVKRFQDAKFNPEDLVRHAQRWGVPAFKQSIRHAVERCQGLRLTPSLRESQLG
jgi:glycosyltransferase involved in cell wall biosynthesis